MILLFFCLGLIVGSFLNVVIFRYGAASVGGHSACLSCGHRLSWSELVPIASFFWLRGRCRACGVRISRQYPLVEFCTGLVFALVFWKHSSLGAPFYALRFALYADLILWSLLIIIAVYDLRHKIIPNAAIYAAIGLSALLFALRLAALGWYPYWQLDLAGAALLPLPFALIWYATDGRAIGLGDAKVLVLFSWLVGFAHGLSALVLGFWLGAAVAVVLLLFRRRRFTMKTELPLAPFFVAGLFIVYLAGVDLTGLTLLLL